MNRYAKKYIDENISSLATNPVLYSQLTPDIYVLNPEKDLSYFLKVDSSLFGKYPDYGPVIDLHNQINEMVAYFKGADFCTSRFPAMKGSYKVIVASFA